jgi:hypothetical protein
MLGAGLFSARPMAMKLLFLIYKDLFGSSMLRAIFHHVV